MIFEVSRCSNLGTKSGPKIDPTWTPNRSKILLESLPKNKPIFSSIFIDLGSDFTSQEGPKIFQKFEKNRKKWCLGPPGLARRLQAPPGSLQGRPRALPDALLKASRACPATFFSQASTHITAHHADIIFIELACCFASLLCFWFGVTFLPRRICNHSQIRTAKIYAMPESYTALTGHCLRVPRCGHGGGLPR